MAGPLSFGTPDEVRAEVREHIDRLAPPGPRQAVWRGATADKYLGAGLQEAFADAPANPFAAAGDQHHFAAEIQGVVHMV